MKGGNERDIQGPDEVEDVTAVLAAPDLGLELDGDNVDSAVVEGLSYVGIVRGDIAADAMSDFGRIRTGLVRRVQCHDLALADRGGQVVCERGDAALARRVCGDESGP